MGTQPPKFSAHVYYSYCDFVIGCNGNVPWSIAKPIPEWTSTPTSTPENSAKIGLIYSFIHSFIYLYQAARPIKTNDNKQAVNTTSTTPHKKRKKRKEKNITLCGKVSLSIGRIQTFVYYKAAILPSRPNPQSLIDLYPKPARYVYLRLVT